MSYLKQITFFIVVFVLAAQAQLSAENYTLQLKLDIVEADKQPSKASVLENLDKLTRRGSGFQMKYIAGGTFTLQEFIQNDFVLKGKDIELTLKAGYTKITDFKFKIFYDASLSFPMQENVMRFTNDFVMDYNEIKALDTTKRPDGLGDTRPYWMVVRLVKVPTEYFVEEVGAIGAFLNIKDGYPYFLDIAPNGPADRGGLKAGEIILAIDEVDTFGKNLQEAIDKTRGKPGTSVKLKVRPPNKKQSREVTLERVIMK
ncbi:MAG: hypothetical protein A3J83_06380 [Elusimicrobia bacterium RIFOXYA2_FULL_40_6]|nr:MAG: hypothetical protein A3J83_06380 [Elusimicrobia bacterium RIFOXYA2_FULL_40_6]